MLGMMAVLCGLLCVPLRAREPVRARRAMVVAQEPLAVDVGLRVLQRGGNAVDAAVAVGFALAVTHPQAGNLGGGGFMLIRFADGRATFLDFRERAPLAATRDMYASDPRGSVEGWRSAGVPGTVRGFEYAQRKYGRLRWADVVMPAVRLAREGFEISYGLAESLRGSPKLPLSAESRRIFLGRSAGDRLRQPELARTLARIARQGANDFYEGETARRLASEMARNGGLITLEDLKAYAVAEREPLRGRYRGFEIWTAPPPSSGGIGLLQMLGMLEDSGYERSGAGAAATIHWLAEAMRRFYADRSQYLGDPDFGTVPVRELLDGAYLRARRASIDLERATPSAAIRPGLPAAERGGETTHYNVVDVAGNAVAVTYTLNDRYGSGITVPGLGFLLNDEMDDFTARPGAPNAFGLIQGEVNAIAPGKRPLSSMTPTIVARDGEFFLALGGPGGARIISAVLQVFLNVVDFAMNVQEAVDAPRVHHQWQPDTLFLEPGISPDTEAILRRMGHSIDHAPGWVPAQVNAIMRVDGWLAGASDGRAGGKAEGY
jgi:gamma-glutamyltranspeptidase/glutathione hydrolase